MPVTSPLALGIHFGHDASVAVCSPQGILFALQEERVSRIKHHFGFPRQSIGIALSHCGLTPQDIGLVAFSTSQALFPERRNAWIVPAEGDRLPADAQSNATARDKLPPAERIKQVREKVRRTWNEFASRHWSEHVDFMEEIGLLRDSVVHYHVAHHRAHAASAFRVSGLTGPAAVLTCDGKGDGLSATIYRGEPDGRMTYVRGSQAADSVGMFYQAVTEALGFVPVDGEYKTMGLAAFGQVNGRPNPFEGIVSVHDGTLASRHKWKSASYNERHPDTKVNNPLGSVAQADEFQRLLDQFADHDVAAFAQAHFEDVMLTLADEAMRLAQSRHLVTAGGVMLNVKANALIRDRLNPASFFVFPDSADGGLAAGAALEALFFEGHISTPTVFRDPYLGHEFSDEHVTQTLERWKGQHALTIDTATPEMVAARIAEGKVIGRFQGRLEVGPRALGNRSVLADPRKPEVKDRINLLLKGREPFVPFAPSILAEDASRYWDGPTDYRYMTFAVRASAEAKREVPAVVHVDGTLRPQVVSDDLNPGYAELIRAFKRVTGVGVLLNTSFNRHGHPIVGSPDDALMHLTNQWVDGLSIGPYYVERGA
ncbi:MAG TPA: carbamoyltransferase C-terminal domain-containing protein [Vicinamibacterales bacterium]|nr:carbamoyltransferase C-terminal domain-containing protein [Vicinamibacterales bacterium]